jgi:hypothetical protein
MRKVCSLDFLNTVWTHDESQVFSFQSDRIKLSLLRNEKTNILHGKNSSIQLDQMNRMRMLILLVLLLLLLVAVTTNPLIKVLLLCRWYTRHLVAAAHGWRCRFFADTCGRWWRTSQGTAHWWGRPSNATSRGWCRHSMASHSYSSPQRSHHQQVANTKIQAWLAPLNHLPSNNTMNHIMPHCCPYVISYMRPVSTILSPSSQQVLQNPWAACEDQERPSGRWMIAPQWWVIDNGCWTDSWLSAQV